jgi:hypothetical protein
MSAAYIAYWGIYGSTIPTPRPTAMVWHLGYFSKASTRKIGDLDDSITSLITIYYGKFKQLLFLLQCLHDSSRACECVCVGTCSQFSGLALLRRCFFVARA